MSEPSARGEWPAASRTVACRPGAHSSEPTAVDERARRLGHEELAVAVLLAGEGHRVVALADRRGHGPVPDLEVCGRPVEVKSFLALPEREGRAPNQRSVCNKLLSARAQAPTVILNGRASGLTEDVARHGVAEFAGRGRVGRIRGIRVVGDGFDLAWSLRLVRDVGIRAVPIPPSGHAAGHEAARREARRSRQAPEPPSGEIGR